MESLTTRFRDEVFIPYLEILKAQYRFHPRFEHARKIWEEKLTENELVNGPYLEKAQCYENGDSLESLDLHPRTIIAVKRRLSKPLYRHQSEALKLMLKGDNAIIATGTSSGKTLCFQTPIINDLIKDPTPGLRAIIIYPLNALVNDQLEEWEKLLYEHPAITFARFTGQTPNDKNEYERNLENAIKKQLQVETATQYEVQKETKRKLEERISRDIPNKLNHREAIRNNPPHILVTNFAMLEYLLERPIDAPIFHNARLRFLVLDEAHSYRGIQATEIAYLVRRLKDRLGITKLQCVATSATLGNKDDDSSREKVRKFASELFGEPFNEPNPIYGTESIPELLKPAIKPDPKTYLDAIDTIRKNGIIEIHKIFGAAIKVDSFSSLLQHDENIFRLRKDILNKPTLLKNAVERLWPQGFDTLSGLQALLELIAYTAKQESTEPLIQTRLHYFVRAQDGLHVCLHKNCPGRKNGLPAYFVSRKNEGNIPEGNCPECGRENKISKLVEVVTCRKCGYLFGALQDTGPRRAQNYTEGSDTSNYQFDTFSTELGWAADSFWSYMSVDDEIPYPKQIRIDEEEEDELDNLLFKPAELDWCVICGKKREERSGDNCNCGCENPHIRKIQIFHRQCPADRRQNLFNQSKHLLVACPNCGARNASGLEPLRRFQESDDETGLAMAIPLAHFKVIQNNSKSQKKLLCFTDHRQRAAAFPSLIEEEAFMHDLGRKIVKIVKSEQNAFSLYGLGERLLKEAENDTDLFLPVSRLPDDYEESKHKKNLWLAETFSYFGIPDSARESAEDIGIISVYYKTFKHEEESFYRLIQSSNLVDVDASDLLQTLFTFLRHRKCFTLPSGISPNAIAFGRVFQDYAYSLRREGDRYTIGWLPRLNKDNSYNDNQITSYLKRVLALSPQEALKIGESFWHLFAQHDVFVKQKNNRWKLDHERLYVTGAQKRYLCNRCRRITTFSVRGVCPRKNCDGKLELVPFEASIENIIARWVSNDPAVRFSNIKSEEHTAQINKELAKRIEDDFRGEGLDLLSSTTTFELGVNIGDLQKVLLRNAPPTSSSYVQRIGRAGRGEEKNSVCVTLCRRTKYDADIWNEPARIMGGIMRPPTVFLGNQIISQRHFNAVLFAHYLRDKLLVEQALGEIGQTISLEAFLPVDVRKKVPDQWRRVRPTDLYLDFTNWLERISEQNTFKTDHSKSLFFPHSSFIIYQNKSRENYSSILQTVSDELVALVSERKKLVDDGKNISEIDQAIKNLLKTDIVSLLAKQGFLPRYAFPLDVVTLETSWSRWSQESDVELARDRSIAISEFAPGSQVIAHKKVFTSAGLYVVTRSDQPERKWYSKCPSCEQVRIARTQDELKKNCIVCDRAITFQFIKPFIEPKYFSVMIDESTRMGSRYRRNTLIRQRQGLTYFIDSVEDSEFKKQEKFLLALKESGSLFRYNLGPEGKGFMLCPSCGFSEPLISYKDGKSHKSLRSKLSSEKYCSNQHPWTKDLAYGHEFKSYCLIIRPDNRLPSVETLAYALHRGICTTLEVDDGDIGVSWRWLSKKQDVGGVELILYDRTPGGAGLVKEAFDNWSSILRNTLSVCENCTCERACYNCLKSYYNQSYHDNLNRYVVIEKLK